MGKGQSPNLNGDTLADALWDTLNDVRSGQLDPAKADAVASQAREILRTQRTRLQICRQARVAVPHTLVQFASPDEKPSA